MSEKRGESNEVVGRGPRARRFSDCSGNSPYNGTVPTSGNSLHRKHVMAVVGNGFQPFRKMGEQPPPTPASGGHEQRGCRARSPNAPFFGLFGEQSLQRNSPYIASM